MSLSPRDAFDYFDLYLSKFTVESDVEVEDQFFDRKQIKMPSHGNVGRRDIQDVKESIQETVSAFANSNPEGGLLVIGIATNGRVLGINHLTEDQRLELSNIGAMLRNQSALVRVHNCVDENGDDNRLLLVYVPETPDAICETLDASSRAWKRADAQNLPLNDRDRAQLRREKNIENHERRLIAPFRDEEIDKELLEEIRNTWPSVIGLDNSDEDLLYALGAIEDTDDGSRKFTSAGLLFFGSNPQRAVPQARVRVLRYDQSLEEADSSSPTLDRTFTGSTSRQLLSVREFLRDSGMIRVRQVRREGGGFEEIPEIPFIAVDEAIVNAVAHRDYDLEWQIECRYYRDAFVVSSPGRLLQRNGTVPSAFTLDERTLQSLPKNPILLHWLKQAKDQKGQQFVRALSEGTKAMLRAMSDAGLDAPEYFVSDSETVVTLRADVSPQTTNVEPSTEFSNLYRISSSGALTGEWRHETLVALADKLRAMDWYIDRLRYGRLTAHVRGSGFGLPVSVRGHLGIFPAYLFALRNFGKHRYLVIDYTVEVKNLQTVSDLLKDTYEQESLLGKVCTARSSQGWRDARIESIDNGLVRVMYQDTMVSESIPSNQVIPSLGLHEIRSRLTKTNFDLSAEIKRHSLASTVGAARRRAEKTAIIAEVLANQVFPLRLGGIDLSLSSTPSRLDQQAGLSSRALREPLVEFDRRQETSNIREGITEFGSYGHEPFEIEIVPIVDSAQTRNVRNLIERLRNGKFKYKGSERTFGVNFRYSSEVALHAGDDVVDTCQRLIDENPSWRGNPKTDRLFLVHSPEGNFASDDERSPYYTAKRLLLEAGIPCQMVDTPTLQNPDWKDLNLALNISAKCGVVPWVLPEGFPDADFFIGLSYTQHRGQADRRYMGYANVFNRYGRWLFYSGNAESFPYEDRSVRLGTLVQETLKKLDGLPETPHVFFHYSARFSKEDRELLLKAAREVRPQGTYSFVWINSHHPIRFYDSRSETDGSLARGTYVITSGNQIYLSTTGYNPYRKTMGTPVPLEVTVWKYAPVGTNTTPADLHSLARQILALTKLNWASSDSLAGEPITTKYAGDIAYLTAAFLRQGRPFNLHPALENTPWFL